MTSFKQSAEAVLDNFYYEMIENNTNAKQEALEQLESLHQQHLNDKDEILPELSFQEEMSMTENDVDEYYKKRKKQIERFNPHV